MQYLQSQYLSVEQVSGKVQMSRENMRILQELLESKASQEALLIFLEDGFYFFGKNLFYQQSFNM